MQPTALIVAPHPDDAEIGMGGTICALLQQGVRVVLVDLTDGEPTPHGSSEIRARETAVASRLLGVSERRNLGIKNREIFDTVDNRKALAAVVREVQPHLMFIPHWEDAHPDHVHACMLCESARFYSKFVKGDLTGSPWYPRKVLHYFSTHLRPRFSPSFIFDISDHLDTKIAAIRAYESQFVVHTTNSARLEAIRNEALFWGDHAGTKAGEPFLCRETIRLTDAGALFSV